MSDNPVVSAPNGSKSPTFYFVGDSPSMADEQYGKPFVGASAQKLRSILHEVGISEDDCRFNYVVPYRLPRGKSPTKTQIAEGFPHLLKDIENTRPKVIVSCGDAPLAAFLSDLKKTPKITGWRGRTAPLALTDNLTCWLYPIWHPDDATFKMLNKSMGTEYGKTYFQDISRLQTIAKKPFPTYPSISEQENLIEYYFDVDEIKEMLKSLSNVPYLGIDLETDGIDPYFSEGFVYPLTVSLATSKRSIAFPISHPEVDFDSDEQKAVFSALIDLLESKTVIGQNTTFDMKWLLVACTDAQKVQLRHVSWHDTMAQAHFLDERSGVLSLDALCFIHFGLPLKSQSDLDIARLRYAPLRKVLRYNALDTYNTYNLFIKQIELLKDSGQLSGYLNHAERLYPLAAMMDRGIPVEGKEVNTQISNLESSEQQALEKLKTQVSELGLNEDFNPNSPKQILTVFKSLGFDMKNDKGKETTNEEKLQTIDHPLAHEILDLRSIRKAVATLKQYQADTDDFYAVHPQFLHTSTTTGRLSSRAPNAQNMSGDQMRRIIAAPEDHIFIDIDYKQLEACIIASCSQDDFFLNALKNDLDVHARWAIWFAQRQPSLIGGKKNLNDPKIIAKFRSLVKNKWVFPAFYNANLYALQHYMGIPDSLAKKAYDLFWDEFSGVRTWQQSLIKFYAKHGYIESPTFRRRYGPLKPTEIVNSPIQGSASDIVVKAMGKLVDRGWVPSANVHDELLFCVRKDDAQNLLNDVREIMLEKLFDWLITPLSITVKAGYRWDKPSLMQIGEFKGTWTI